MQQVRSGQTLLMRGSGLPLHNVTSQVGGYNTTQRVADYVVARCSPLNLYLAEAGKPRAIPWVWPAHRVVLQATYFCAREAYSPERVSTLITSPVCTNRGTLTTAPVLNVAGLPPVPAVSPLRPCLRNSPKPPDAPRLPRGSGQILRTGACLLPLNL